MTLSQPGSDERPLYASEQRPDDDSRREQPVANSTGHLHSSLCIGPPERHHTTSKGSQNVSGQSQDVPSGVALAFSSCCED